MIPKHMHYQELADRPFKHKLQCRCHAGIFYTGVGDFPTKWIEEHMECSVTPKCRCGSGAHPRYCALHPDRYYQHVHELNLELTIAELEDIETERDLLRDAVRSLEYKVSLMHKWLASEGTPSQRKRDSL